MLVTSAMDSILRNPEWKGKIMTFMILFIALVESVAIYGLVVALQLLK
jgi:F0F1-type ATP synthase membrane subunit c/vacuolar-type H+-ATPase subunit K